MRYKETHGENPSADQMANMVQISRELEHKDYIPITQTHDRAEIDFLRRKEGDLLLSHGLTHNTADDLIHAQTQAKKSLEITARLEKEQHHMNDTELSL